MPGPRRGAASLLFSLAAVGVTAVAFVCTWLRLFVGMDLRDESYYVLVPWRWVLGDQPFVHDENLAQAVPSLLEYPFVKLFGMLRGYDVTGLVLYMRHLYLLLMLGVAVAAFLLLRRMVRWQLALLASTVCFTYIHWATPQLSYNTIAIAFLTLGAILGAWVVAQDKGRGYALASGMAFGVAVAAYPSLLFLMPFYAVFLVFALGARAVAVIAEGDFVHPPSPDGPSTGRAAWRALSAWVAGGVLVLVPMGLLILSFGLSNVLRCLKFTAESARGLHQLGGASKAVSVTLGLWRFVSWRPYIVVVALLVYLVYRRRPRLGRCLLLILPVALWLEAQRPLLWASGFVLLYALAAPYLYLFVPRERRSTGAKLLIWVWVPAVLAGAMTAYTSTVGYVSAAVGLAPAMVVSGLFLAWALEAIVEPGGGPQARLPGQSPQLPWPALAGLVAVVVVTLVFQFQFQQRDVPFRDLSSRFSSGPWWGIKVVPQRRQLLDGFAVDLKAQGRSGDQLFVFDEGPGYYLYWNGGIASNSYWMGVDPATGLLYQSTVRYYRRHRVVPSLIVHLVKTEGMSAADLQATSGGLDYPPVLVRPWYAFQRQPADESTADVLARLPRE